MTDPRVAEYERRAQEAESSPTPVIIKIGRGIVWAVYVLVLINAILLGIAFFLRLFGANPDAGFTQWIYRSSAAAMGPFDDMFRSHDLGGNSVLDTSLVFAIIVYLVVALCIHALLNWLGNTLVKQENAAKQARHQADAIAYDYAQQQQAARSRSLAEQQAENQRQQLAQQQQILAQQAARDAAAQQAVRDAAARHAAQEAANQQASRDAAAQQAAAQQAAWQAANDQSAGWPSSGHQPTAQPWPDAGSAQQPAGGYSPQQPYQRPGAGPNDR